MMRHLWLWAMLVAVAGLWVAGTRPRAADPTPVPITLAVSEATNAQLECPH